MPTMFGPGSDKIETWMQAHEMYPFGDFVRAHRTEIADALDSVLIGDRSKRRLMDILFVSIRNPEERKRAQMSYHDITRNSTVDIGRRAWKIAESLRKEPL